MTNEQLPTGWHISHNPKPIPIRTHDYDFWNDNVDIGNGLSGTASSYRDAVAQIKEIDYDGGQNEQ